MSINVANNNPHVVYTVAEGATQTVFSITFEFFDDDEVQLYVDGIIKTQGSGDGKYTITGGEGSTGTATFNTVSSGTQPVTGITGGSQVVVTRNIPIERVTDFSAGSDINRAALNTQLDTLTAIAADNKMRSVRALTAPISDPTDVGTNLIIPKAADRANGFLSFDSSGNVAINSVVDLSFLTLERLDIDNVRIDGSTISSIDSGALTIGSELIVSGNLTVNGTTTTINSTTLTVDDKNIVLASGAATSLAADGAGITIDGASASLTYVNLTDAMTFNKDVDIGDNVIENAQKLHFTENVSLYPSSGDDSILNLQAEDVGSAQLRFITGTGSGVFRGGIAASQNNVFGLKDSNDQIFIKSQDGNLPTQILHTYDSPSAGSVVRIEAGSTFVKLYGSDGVEAQKYKDADDTSYYLEPAGTSVLATVGVTQLDVDNITIDGNTISSTDTDGNINLRCNGNGVVDVDSELFVYGNATNGTAAYVQIGNTDTGGDDIRIQGPNPNFTLYDSTAVADGVAAYTGGLLFYGQKTNTAYHTYSAIRPRIINGLDSDTAKTGALHFGVSDGASSALTNIIFKVEPDGIDVTGSITSSSDPLKISATTASGNPNIIFEGDASPSVAIRADGSNTNRLLLRYDNSNDFSYVSASGNLSIEATNTGHTLSLTSNDGMFITNSSSNLTITSSSSDIVLKTGTSGSTSERFKVTGAGIVQSLVETQIVDETLKVTNGSTYGSLSMDENTGSSRDYFDIKAFGHDGSSTEGGAVRLFSASNLESIRTYSTGTTGAGYTTFNFPYDLSYGTGVYHLTVASANRSGLYLRSDVSGSDADGKQYGELSASSSEFKMVGWFGANIEFKIGGDLGETKIAEVNSDGLAFEDNKKAIFGDSQNLEIYANGGYSYIDEVGANNLNIRTNGADIGIYDTANSQYMARFATGSNARLFFDGDQKIATTSTGVDITGVLTSDGLTVDGAASASSGSINLNSTDPTIRFYDSNGVADNRTFEWRGVGGSGFEGMYLRTINDAQNSFLSRMRIQPNGDISFYEDTGTTAKFFWDASAEGLGVGYDPTVATDTALSVSSLTGGVGTNPVQQWKYTNDNNTMLRLRQIVTSGLVKHTFDVKNAGTDYNNNLVLDRGNVGIGTDSPDVFSRAYSGTTVGISSASGESAFMINSSGTNVAALEIGRAGARETLIYDTSTTTQIGSVTSKPVIFFTGGSEAMRIDSSGRLGIGTSDPSTPRRMDVLGSASDTYSTSNSITDNVVARFRNGSDSNTAQRYGGISLESGNAQFAVQTVQTGTYGGALTFKTRTGASSYAERMRIDASGSVFIGKTGEIGTQDGFQFKPTGECIVARGSNDTMFIFQDSNSGGAQVGSISMTSSSTSYNTSSDYRLKTDAQPMTGATDRIKQLNPVNFEWIVDGTRVDGFLAHEAQAVVPEAVTGTKDAMRDEEYEVTPAVTDDDGNITTEAVMGTRSVPDYQGIDQSKLVPLLVATIKELEARITALENA